MQPGSKPTRNVAVHSLFADSERKSRLKERIALHPETAMSIATYRGIKYDTETHQANFKTWWNRIHCDASRWFTYRGNLYRGTKECQI